VNKILKLGKKRLEYLYLKKKLGSYDIAKILKCSASHVRDSLRENSIKTRSIQEAKALTKPRYPRKNFSGNLREKAYLIGFRLGDLHISQTHPNSPTIRISTNTTKKEQLSLFRRLFSSYGHVKAYNPDKNGAISIRCFANRSFNFLLKKEDAVEKWILKNKALFLRFMAGYIDAEGSFCICRNDGVFSIRSQDKNIVWTIYEELRKRNVLCKKPKMVWAGNTKNSKGLNNNKDVWALVVYRKDSLLKLINTLNPLLKHEKRFNDMKAVESNILNRNILYNNKKDNCWYKTYT